MRQLRGFLLSIFLLSINGQAYAGFYKIAAALYLLAFNRLAIALKKPHHEACLQPMHFPSKRELKECLTNSEYLSEPWYHETEVIPETASRLKYQQVTSTELLSIVQDLVLRQPASNDAESIQRMIHNRINTLYTATEACQDSHLPRQQTACIQFFFFPKPSRLEHCLRKSKHFKLPWFTNKQSNSLKEASTIFASQFYLKEYLYIEVQKFIDKELSRSNTTLEHNERTHSYQQVFKALFEDCSLQLK